MAVDTDAVEAYTGGRLSADADETQALLDRALAACRTFCGWHVSPFIEEDEIVVDGPGVLLLGLPTMHVVDLTELFEDGTELDVDTDISWSRNGLVRKASGDVWTGNYQGVEVTLSHGYSTAPDFELAVLKAVDAMSSQASSTQQLKQVADVQYYQSASTTVLDTTLLAPYRLEPL